MADPNASHLEQAKQHLRDAAHPITADSRTDLYLIWAIDEIIRHIEKEKP